MENHEGKISIHRAPIVSHHHLYRDYHDEIFKSNGSGSSSLSHLKDQNPIPPSVSRNGSYSSSSHYNNNYGNYHDYYLGVVVMTHGENPVVVNHDYRHHQIHLQLHHRLLINSTD